ncbi:MAG: hypothetical protein ACXITV_06855 [Luteibaculaceae bacterium]
MRFFTFLVIFLAAAPTFGQFKLIPIEAEISIGSLVTPAAAITTTDFQVLAPNATVNALDTELFNRETMFFGMAGSTFNVGLGFSIFDKKKSSIVENFTFRLNVTYNNQEVLAENFTFSSRTVIDTIISRTSGAFAVTDSIYEKGISKGYNQQRIFVQGGLLAHTDKDRRFHLYGGVGAGLGFTYGNTTTLNVFEHARVNNLIEGNDISNRFDFIDSQFENNANRAGYFASAYLKVGWGYRLSKKNEIAKNAYFFSELDYGVCFFNIPELRAKSQIFFLFQTGLRYNFN